MPMLRLPSLLLLPLVTGLLTVDTNAQTLQPHRAVYDLALKNASKESGVQSLAGRWVFEFSGSTCEGYTLNSRIVMRFDMEEGPRTIDQRANSFEDAEGNTLRFDTESFINQTPEREVSGTAKRDASVTVVQYEEPETVERTLGHALFPTGQLRELLQKAKAGEHFYETKVFDGTEFSDEAAITSVVVGDPKPVSQDDPERQALKDLAAEEWRPVTMAYFDGESTAGEETSDYNVSFKLSEKGVQRDMLIHYEDYSVTGKLVDLSLFDPEGSCAEQ